MAQTETLNDIPDSLSDQGDLFRLISNLLDTIIHIPNIVVSILFRVLECISERQWVIIGARSGCHLPHPPNTLVHAAMASIATKRLAKELRDLHTNGCPVGIEIIEVDDKWIMGIEVLGETLYEVRHFTSIISIASQIDSILSFSGHRL